MRRIILHTLIALLLTGIPVVASPIQIDFGPIETPGNWNNVTVDLDTVSPGSALVGDLINADGVTTGISFNYVSDIAGSIGSANPGYTVASGDAAALPATAVQDLFFISGTDSAQDTILELRGLSSTLTYDLDFFAGIAADRDDTRFIVNGVTQSTPTTDNTAFVRFDDVVPDSNDIIRIIIREQNNNGTASAAYINALIVTPIPEPASLMLLASGGVLMLSRRRQRP